MQTGCSDDPLSSEDSEMVVTVQGESAFGEWKREFVGLASRAEEFSADAATIVRAVAEQFDGAVEVDISVGDQLFETVAITGEDEDIVPAAILAAHDLTALRLGFLPKGSIDELNIPNSIVGSKPCTCMGAGCCCTSAWAGGSCGNIFLECTECKSSKGSGGCIGGTQCWVGLEEG